MRVGGLVDLVSAPQFATAAGILLYGTINQNDSEGIHVPAFLMGRLSSRVKEFFSGVFGAGH